MRALDVAALPAIGYAPNQHRLMRPEEISWIRFWQLPMYVSFDRNEIENGYEEVLNPAGSLMRDIARHRKSFQVYLRSHDG